MSKLLLLRVTGGAPLKILMPWWGGGRVALTCFDSNVQLEVRPSV